MSVFSDADRLAQSAIADTMAEPVDFVGQTVSTYGRADDPARPLQRGRATPLISGVSPRVMGSGRSDDGSRVSRTDIAASLYMTAADFAALDWPIAKGDIATVDPDGMPSRYEIAAVIAASGGDFEIHLTRER